MSERPQAIAITGLCPVTPLGSGAERYWQALVDGERAISKITRFDTGTFPVKLAGEVHDVDPTDTIDRRLLVATDRWTHHSLVATERALAGAGIDLDGLDPYDVAVITAACSGGNEFGQREIASLWARGPRSVTVYQSIAWFYAASTGQISIRHGSKGMCGVVVAGAAGGLDTLAKAATVIRQGTQVVIAGATEAAVSPYALTCQLDSGGLSTATDPATAYQPFGAGASGYVVGEGGSMFVLEPAERAQRRGAEVLAVIAGHGATQDGRRRASLDVETAAAGLAEAITHALDRAGITAVEVDAVIADGAGVAHLDQAEATALRLALGGWGSAVPVTVPKAATGRGEAGSACTDVAAAVLALRHQTVPPTVGTGPLAAAAEINLVRTATPRRLRHVLVLARGHGGFNSALVVRGDA
jgi:3-oxoacyl-(acyl-carrier-protein) synthase